MYTTVQYTVSSEATSGGAMLEFDDDAELTELHGEVLRNTIDAYNAKCASGCGIQLVRCHFLTCANYINVMLLVGGQWLYIQRQCANSYEF